MSAKILLFSIAIFAFSSTKINAQKKFKGDKYIAAVDSFLNLTINKYLSGRKSYKDSTFSSSVRNEKRFIADMYKNNPKDSRLKWNKIADWEKSYYPDEIEWDNLALIDYAIVLRQADGRGVSDIYTYSVTIKLKSNIKEGEFFSSGLIRVYKNRIWIWLYPKLAVPDEDDVQQFKYMKEHFLEYQIPNAK